MSHTLRIYVNQHLLLSTISDRCNIIFYENRPRELLFIRLVTKIVPIIHAPIRVKLSYAMFFQFQMKNSARLLQAHKTEENKTKQRTKKSGFAALGRNQNFHQFLKGILNVHRITEQSIGNSPAKWEFRDQPIKPPYLSSTGGNISSEES